MMSKNREEHGLQLLPILIEPVVGHETPMAPSVYSLSATGPFNVGCMLRPARKKIMLNDEERGKK